MPMKTNIMSAEQQEHAYRTCIEIVSVQQETGPWTTDEETLVRQCALKFQWMCYATPEDMQIWKEKVVQYLDSLLEVLQKKELRERDKENLQEYFVRLVNLSFLVESDAENARRFKDRKEFKYSLGWHPIGGHTFPGRKKLLLRVPTSTQNSRDSLLSNSKNYTRCADASSTSLLHQ
jgi:hypothetical protein